MRTLQEKYNGINEGKFTKDQFLRDARMEQPSLVTQYNGYDDAVQILKNRGMIQEVKLTEDTPEESSAIASIHAITKAGQDAIRNFIKDNEIDPEAFSRYVTQNRDNKFDIARLISGQEVPGMSVGSLKQLKEARITNKSLPDYRYKVTNDMDKYPYEQILRGLRVELEGLNILGTPTPEEYKKALGKVLKNLEKDTIFYTNQVAGVSKKVDLHDKMVDVKKDNAVDKFNGLKKAQLKEAKDPDIQELVLKLLKKNPSMTWTQAMKKVKEDLEDNKPQKDQLKEAIKGVIKNILSEGSAFGEGERVYEMQGPKEDSYYKSELSDYLDDNGIFGLTDRIHNIMTGPDEAENVDDLVRFLEDNQIYGRYGIEIEKIYADYPYDQHWMNQPDEDEDDKADDIPHPRGYEQASHEEDFDDLFKESKSEEELRAKWDKHQSKSHEGDMMPYGEWESGQRLVKGPKPNQKVIFINTNDDNTYVGTVVKDLGDDRFTFRAKDGKVYSSDGFGDNWKIEFEAGTDESIFESVSLKDIL